MRKKPDCIRPNSIADLKWKIGENERKKKARQKKGRKKAAEDKKIREELVASNQAESDRRLDAYSRYGHIQDPSKRPDWYNRMQW